MFWRAALLACLCGVALAVDCSVYENCWACSAREECGWCGSKSLCQLMSNYSNCPFTLWKGTCCRVLTPAQCGTCVLEAGCGWCEGGGCVKGDLNGPSEACAGVWYFEQCPQHSYIILFSAVDVVLGLTVTIGGGLVLAIVSIFVVWVRRLLHQRNADKEYSRLAHQRSCAVCGDMLASMECSVCKTLLCHSCMPASVKCKGRAQGHELVAIQLADQGDEHYSSFRF